MLHGHDNNLGEELQYRKLVRDFETRIQGPAAKQDFLELFGRAYLLSFDSQTIRSAFRATGVYPFNREAISAEKMKPSESSSHSASFPLPLATPVRRIMAVYHHQPPTAFDVDLATHLAAEEQPHGSHGNGTTTGASQTAVLDPTLDPALFTPTKRARALYSTLAQSSSASFLVAKEKLTAERSIPPIVLEKVPAYIEEPDWRGMQHSLKQLTLSGKNLDDVAELSQNIARAQLQNRVQKSITEAAQAQLVVATVYNAGLQRALYGKEKAKSSKNVRILDDGAPRIWTSEESLEQVW